VECVERDGSQGGHLYEVLPWARADLLTDLPPGEVARRNPPGQTLLYLCIKGCAQSESPLVRESRLKDSSMAQGYRLYPRHWEAPPQRQQEG
jgi:hypothetical protein